MKNAYIYIVSAVLAVFAFSGKAIAAADGDPDYTKITASKAVKSVDKDGTVTLRLETFVQGDSSNVMKTTPLDVVFVLDVSGSMEWPVSMANDYYNTTEGLDTSKNYFLLYNNVNTQTVYNLAYKDGAWKYQSLSGGNWSKVTGLTTNPYGNDDKWWTAMNTTDTKSRLNALKEATADFITEISKDAASKGAGHRVGVVKFSSDAGIAHKLDVNYSGAIQDVNALSFGGGTNSDKGMSLVNSSIFTKKSDDTKQVVVMFTDGAPGSGTFDSSVATKTIAASKNLKDKGVTVFTVGVFSTETNNIKNYMNYTSSKYPKATSMTSYGTPVEDDYYYKALTAQELKEIFNRIIKSVLDNLGGTGCPLETENVTLKDIVTPSFVVPEGESTVTLKMVNAVLDSNKDVTWSSEEVDAKWTDKNGVERRATVKSTANNTIDVVGFDFNKFWYGLVRKYNGEAKPENEVKSERVAHGAKLIIEIKIKPNPDAEGGYQPTNSDKSGVYVDGVLTPVRYYDVPAPVFVSILELEIQNTSLKENESAIYTVTRKDSKGLIDPDYSVEAIVSAYKEGNSAALVNSVKLKVEARDPYSEPYTYIVTPNNDWDWTYKDASAISSKLYTVASDGTITVIEENPFVFSNASETVNALHDEHFNKNVFSK